MMFDPFGDLATRGYLRNAAGSSDPNVVKKLEHSSFLDNLDDALKHLRSRKKLTYRHVLDTHRILFQEVYPWAGQDRAMTAPDIAVARGTVLFAHPDHARAAVEFALGLGQDKATMKAKPGLVMGYLAHGHPFLDGNGRTIMTVHAVLAQRAGIAIDWSATRKNDYLTALTRELDAPDRGHLDSYLAPFVVKAVGHKNVFSAIARAPGLDGAAQQASGDRVLGSHADPSIQKQYWLMRRRRSEPDPSP